MRIESQSLPLAAQQHSRVHGSSRTYPGKAAGLEAATRPATGAAENLPSPANPAASATPTGTRETLTPAGLLAAQLRFQEIAESDRTRGQNQALEMISRNLARYQTPADTAPATPATTA